MSEAEKIIDPSGQFEAVKEQTLLEIAEQARAAGIDEATLGLFNTAFAAFGEIVVTFMRSAGDELKGTRAEVDKLKRHQDILVEQIEDLQDRADIAAAKRELLQTGEEPMTLEALERSLDTQGGV